MRDGGDQRETRVGNGCRHRLLVDVAAARDRRRVRREPGSGARIPVHVADGSVVKAKAVVLDSVRVGRFTAHNVECTVFPPGVDKAPPLLGMSFLGRFKVQLNGDQMVLAPLN